MARTRATAVAAAQAAPSASVNPCGLVTVKQMQSLTHRNVRKRTLAPLGPTCIYVFNGSPQEVTISVEHASFSQLTRQMRKRKRVTVLRRQAYCGEVGQATLYVSLPSGRVLDVVAGCSVGQRIAAIAVARLGA